MDNPEAAATIITSVPERDRVVFEKFLRQRGLKQFETFVCHTHTGVVCILFLNKGEAVRYRLGGIETDFLIADRTMAPLQNETFSLSDLGLDWDSDQ